MRLGVLGLGRAFTLMVPTFSGDARVRLVAAFDPQQAACKAFELTFGGTSMSSAEAVCSHPDVEWVYVATPHQMHADHVVLAASHGKHVLVEKPLALSLDDCTRMIDACEAAGTQVIVGHSQSFDAPVLLTKALMDSGDFGRVCMVHAMQYTDFMYRPRRPEELDTSRGGVVVFSQAAHHMDMGRLRCGGGVTRLQRRGLDAHDVRVGVGGDRDAVAEKSLLGLECEGGGGGGEPEQGELGRGGVTWAANYYVARRDIGVSPRTSSSALRSRLAEPLPTEGRDISELLRLFQDVVVPGSRHNGHPRALGYVSSPGTAVAAMADFLASVLNANLTAWRSSPAPVELERVAIGWIREAMGLDPAGGGLFLSGGSMAHLAALTAARHHHCGEDVAAEGFQSLTRPLRAYASQEVHHSIDKAAALLGI